MALTIKEAVRKWGTEYLTICGIANYFPTMNYNSHVFFVNGISTIGDDGVNRLGQIPDEPFLTITKALSECTDGANDYIFILDYPSTAPAETWPIVIDKQRVHIIGVRNGLLPRFKICAPGGTVDTPVFAFDDNVTNSTYGSYCEIANLIIGSEKADSIRGAIESHYAGVWGNHIHHCHFGPEGRSNTGASYGIVAGRSSNTYQAGEMLYGLIEKCTFGKSLIEAGIFVPEGQSGPNACYGLVIRDNIFYVNSGDVGIHITKTTANLRNGGIYNNRFILAADDTGDAITLAAGVTGGFIDGNVAGVLANLASMENNPYLTTTACGPAWGRNWKGGSELVVRPALA